MVGGDQLTRVRLQDAKNLRNIAVTPKRQFEDLNPYVVEMWHNKQALLKVSLHGKKQQYKKNHTQNSTGKRVKINQNV